MASLWQDLLYPILKSTATTNLIAFFSVLAVFIIYFLRRRDSKRDAANIILLELKNAENKLLEARKSYEEGQTARPSFIKFPEKIRLMSTESWTKYKYLFVRDFEPEQWDEIGKFYENCRNFDEAVEHKDNTFELNEADIRANIQRNIADYAKKLAEGTKPNPDNDPAIVRQNTELETKIKAESEIAFRANVSTLVQLYNPDKSFTDAAYYFNLLPTSIMNTPIGETLRRLAGVSKHRRSFGHK